MLSSGLSCDEVSLAILHFSNGGRGCVPGRFALPCSSIGMGICFDLFEAVLATPVQITTTSATASELHVSEGITGVSTPRRRNVKHLCGPSVPVDGRYPPDHDIRRSVEYSD